ALAVLQRSAEDRPAQAQPLAPERVLVAPVPSVAAAALARVERIERALYEPLRQEFVSRPAPPGAAAPATSPSVKEAPRQQRGFAAAPSAPQDLPPSIDLERLTDRLMRNIDRRLVSSRERNGRI